MIRCTARQLRVFKEVVSVGTSLPARLTLRGVATVLLLAAACSPTASPRASDTPPSIIGRITAVTSSGDGAGTIRVEERPEDASGSAKASVRISQGTAITRSGERAGFDALRVGQWVRVWFSGPVAESYPVQATGSAVVIDSLPR